MAKYKWLMEITNICDFSINDDEGNYVNVWVSPHNGRFFQTPQVIRRCFFLNTTELAVLWELLDWMHNEGGYCRVSQKTIAFYTGISDRTVRKAIKSLIEKEFISKKSSNSTDIYKINNKLKYNPYVLLSEFIYDWCRTYILPKNGKQMMEFEVDYSMPLSLEYMRKAVDLFIKNRSQYHIRKMKTADLTKDSVLQNCRLDIFEDIHDIYTSFK